jgi:hypothetical protein
VPGSTETWRAKVPARHLIGFRDFRTPRHKGQPREQPQRPWLFADFCKHRGSHLRSRTREKSGAEKVDRSPLCIRDKGPACRWSGWHC